MNDVRATLCAIIAEVTRGRVSASEERALSSELDSVERLEIVVVIEERLGVALTSADMTDESWQSIEKLTALIAGRR